MMVTRFYFCWERGAHGRWQPVCYHGAPPWAEQVSAGDSPSRSTVHLVPADLIGADGAPMFHALAQRFAAPVVVV